MTETDQVLEVRRFLSTVLQKEARLSAGKADMIAAQFSSLESFKHADFGRHQFKSQGGKIIKLNKQILERIEDVKTLVIPKAGLPENWIRFTTHHITNKIMTNLSNLTLEYINMNPFLIRMLHLRTPEELLRFNVYQTVSRSIVTSMGTGLEYMIADSGGKRVKGKWYDVVKKKGKDTYWIQVKSGPNNIDKDQVEAFNKKFIDTEKMSGNNHPKLGIVYGKRNLKTVSLGLVKKYMQDWEDRLLVGRELWDFMSEEKNYHKKVMFWIEDAVMQDLKNKSIDDMIQTAIKRLLREFKSKYGDGDAGVRKYLDDII